MESPEVRFDDVETGLLTDRVTTLSLDQRFVYVCEADTIKACGYSCNKPVSLGIVIDKNRMTITKPRFSGKVEAVIRLTAIRKGFFIPIDSSPYNRTRFPQRNAQQFEENEASINSNYSSHE